MASSLIPSMALRSLTALPIDLRINSLFASDGLDANLSPKEDKVVTLDGGVLKKVRVVPTLGGDSPAGVDAQRALTSMPVTVAWASALASGL